MIETNHEHFLAKNKLINDALSGIKSLRAIIMEKKLKKILKAEKTD